MDLAVNIAIGSSAQIALFVAPVLVLALVRASARARCRSSSTASSSGAFCIAVLIANQVTQRGRVDLVRRACSCWRLRRARASRSSSPDGGRQRAQRALRAGARPRPRRPAAARRASRGARCGRSTSSRISASSAGSTAARAARASSASTSSGGSPRRIAARVAGRQQLADLGLAVGAASRAGGSLAGLVGAVAQRATGPCRSGRRPCPCRRTRSAPRRRRPPTTTKRTIPKADCIRRYSPAADRDHGVPGGFRLPFGYRLTDESIVGRWPRSATSPASTFQGEMPPWSTSR